jgi:hypothetical protein
MWSNKLECLILESLSIAYPRFQRLARTTALALLVPSSVVKKKSFTTWTPVANVIKLFLIVAHEVVK